jgi:hypothetical protein
MDTIEEELDMEFIHTKKVFNELVICADKSTQKVFREFINDFLKHPKKEYIKDYLFHYYRELNIIDADVIVTYVEHLTDLITNALIKDKLLKY